jgi:L-ribulose-5-phosphate 3-epimerase
MNSGRIGVVVDSFGVGAKEGLRLAARLGFRAVAVDASQGAIAPESLSQSGRRHFRRYVSGLGLSLVALGGRFASGDLVDPHGIDERFDRLGALLELAREVGSPAVTTRVGRIGPAGSGAHDRAVEALRYLAERADATGTRLAVETAGLGAEALAAVLRAVDSRLVGACYDPAELMMQGDDPIEGLGAVGEHILVAYLRDAMAGREGRFGYETPLGQGQIDLHAVLGSLSQVSLVGPPLLRRIGAHDPVAELTAAKAHVESLLR